MGVSHVNLLMEQLGMLLFNGGNLLVCNFSHFLENLLPLIIDLG